ncbi:hypothetical protein [Nocardia sp. NPDC057455]|uniref:hypothetical protein n=1 Tax=Nocardia sp. NPDC057455 TaxID=3346138 RepID=UPI00366CEC37
MTIIHNYLTFDTQIAGVKEAGRGLPAAVIAFIFMLALVGVVILWPIPSLWKLATHDPKKGEKA